MKKVISAIILTWITAISMAQVSIYEIQGQSAASPYADQVVTTEGIVTGVYGLGYFIQDGEGAWNGI